jgi:hypothetical protein
MSVANVATQAARKAGQNGRLDSKRATLRHDQTSREPSRYIGVSGDGLPLVPK